MYFHRPADVGTERRPCTWIAEFSAPGAVAGRDGCLCHGQAGRDRRCAGNLGGGGRRRRGCQTEPACAEPGSFPGSDNGRRHFRGTHTSSSKYRRRGLVRMSETGAAEPDQLGVGQGRARCTCSVLVPGSSDDCRRLPHGEWTFDLECAGIDGGAGLHIFGRRCPVDFRCALGRTNQYQRGDSTVRQLLHEHHESDARPIDICGSQPGQPEQTHVGSTACRRSLPRSPAPFAVRGNVSRRDRRFRSEQERYRAAANRRNVLRLLAQFEAIRRSSFNTSTTG